MLYKGGEIAQSLVSLSTKWAIRVRARLEPLVIERRNSITVLLTRSHQCRRLVHNLHALNRDVNYDSINQSKTI